MPNVLNVLACDRTGVRVCVFVIAVINSENGNMGDGTVGDRLPSDIRQLVDYTL